MRGTSQLLDLFELANMKAKQEGVRGLLGTLVGVQQARPTNGQHADTGLSFSAWEVESGRL